MLHEWKETFPIVSKRFPSKSLDHTEHKRVNTHDKFITKALDFSTVELLIYVLTWFITHSQFSLGISRQISSSFVKELFSKTLSVIETQCGDANFEMLLIVTHIQMVNLVNLKRAESIQSHLINMERHRQFWRWWNERSFKTVLRTDRHIFISKGKFMIFWKKSLLNSTQQ